ncbi:hypothetical protein [Nocardiopsis sp. NPDC058789]|uniref:hypothetical protein n=1 Tax=Nocardiopsis TaxID=2013 RepID=UPI0036711F44
MFAWPALGVLVGIAVPVAVIFLVLGIFRIVQRQAEKAVRSPDYWKQVPDGTGPAEEQDAADETEERDGARGRPGDDR